MHSTNACVNHDHEAEMNAFVWFDKFHLHKVCTINLIIYIFDALQNTVPPLFCNVSCPFDISSD